MAEKKMTKVEKFDIIEKIVDALGEQVADNFGCDAQVLIDFCKAEKALLTSKAERAAGVAAKKKAAGAEFKERVKALLTDEFQSCAKIAETFADEEDITLAKVRARLSELVRDGVAVKDNIKDEETKKSVMCYKLA